MQPLPGVTLPSAPFAAATWQRDLVNYDGPFLSEFRNAAGEPMLYSWCDRDETANRWLVFRVRERDLIRLTARRADLHELVSSPADGLVYFLDLDDDLEVRGCSVAAPAQMPPQYMPDRGSFLPAPTPLAALHLMRRLR